jgi:tetratricopeptide (TPR) repeat protein
MVRATFVFCAFFVTIPNQSRADAKSSKRNWPGPDETSSFLDSRPQGEAAKHVRAALAARQSGDARQEIKEWTEVIKLAPNENAAFYYRVRPYDELTLFSKAIADSNEYVRREPNDPRGWAQLGNSLADGGQIQKAIAACQRGLQLDPGNAMSHATLGDIYRLNSQWPEALREAETAQKLNPKLPRAYQVMGRVYAERKDYEKAASAFSKAIRLDPTWVNPLVARGDALMDGNKYKPALADYREAVRRFPRSSRAHTALAQFLATCRSKEWRDGKEALVEAKIACIQADWKDPYAVAALSYAKAETGDFADAIRLMKQVLAISLPSDRADFQNQLDALRKGKPWRE